MTFQAIQESARQLGERHRHGAAPGGDLYVVRDMNDPHRRYVAVCEEESRHVAHAIAGAAEGLKVFKVSGRRAEEIRLAEAARRNFKPMDRVIDLTSGGYDRPPAVGTVIAMPPEGLRTHALVRWDDSSAQVMREPLGNLAHVDDVVAGHKGNWDQRAWLSGERKNYTYDHRPSDMAAVPAPGRRVGESVTSLTSALTRCRLRTEEVRVACPSCGTEQDRSQSFLGKVGGRDHHRCSQCNQTFSTKAVGRPVDTKRAINKAIMSEAYRSARPKAGDLVRIFKISEDDAKQVVKLMTSNARNSKVYDVLGEIDKIIGGSGVEALCAGDAGNDAYVSGYWRDNICVYVNMGDTYANTVFYDTMHETYHVGTWGDFFEWFERNNHEYY